MAFPTVSRRHAKLTVDGQKIVLQDIGSSTGIFVIKDGEWAQITHVTLHCDDPVKLGGYKTTARTMLAAVGVKFDASSGSNYSRKTTVPRRSS